MRSGLFLLFCVSFSEGYAQTSGRLEFEAASIKPAPAPDPNGWTAGCRGGPGTDDPDLFNCVNMTLGNLVALAYRVDLYRLAAPEWLQDTRLIFDLNARVLHGATKEQFLIMFQNLLADRFKLAVHRETREMRQYDLLVAKNGPRFKLAAPADSSPSQSALQRNGCPALPALRGAAFISGQEVLHIPDLGMEALSAQLAYLLRAPVRDATGLTGKYDIAMCWALDNTGGATPGPNGIPVGPDSGPTLQQALQDQLGLRLESRKGPVEVIAVEHAEQFPTEN